MNLDIRDEHGKVLSDEYRNSRKRFYETQAFHSPDLRGLPPKERRDAVKDAWDVVQEGMVSSRCMFVTPPAEETPISHLFDAQDLAFGEKQSVGFICGIKEGVINRDQAVPGHCCLDSPYGERLYSKSSLCFCFLKLTHGLCRESR